MSALTPTCSAQVEMLTTGRIGTEERDCARAMVGAVLAHHHVPVQGARVRLTGPRAPDGPVLMQVNLRVCGAPARIQVPGRSTAAAIAAGTARLERQIRRLGTAWRPWPWPDPERRTLGVPGRGRVARVKEYPLLAGMPCQANAVMTALDYDVHLYTDAETGEDAVVYRSGPRGVRLARQRSMHPPAMPGTVPLTVNSRRVPALTRAEAAERLAAGCLPFLFFTDRDSGRGNLIYRRYDGDLGLIRPAASPHVTSAHRAEGASSAGGKAGPA